jgi:dihydrofolate reductase
MVNCIVAVELNQGIGFNNSMPWPRLKDDLKFFKNMTTSSIVIMGSSTFKSLEYKPLPNRINVVLSRTHPYPTADHTFHNPDTALAFCTNEYPDKEIFIIGGSEIYNLYFPYVKKFYITEIDAHFQCDKFFNLTYVQNNCKKVKELLKFKDPINFTIKEYTI